MTSYYGLLSVNEISAPVPINKSIKLPYYPGCRYAAYTAQNSEEVCLFIVSIQFIIGIKQAGTVTLFNGWPDKLIYHEKSFHVLDIVQLVKVFRVTLSTQY